MFEPLHIHEQTIDGINALFMEQIYAYLLQ